MTILSPTRGEAIYNLGSADAPLKYTELVIKSKFSPYMHHHHIISMHPQGNCTTLKFPRQVSPRLVQLGLCVVMDHDQNIFHV
jgi:hypothetical protein